MTHICVSKLTIIGSDNGLSPGRRQAIIWTNAGILLIGHWGTTFSEILIGIQTFSFKKMHLKMSSAKWRPFCLGLNVLRCCPSPILWGWQYNESITNHVFIYTVETLYNTINFCWSTHKRHPIARPKGRGMGCLLWVQRATYCVDLSILSSIKYLL